MTFLGPSSVKTTYEGTFMSPSERLRKERERLGYSQTEFAALVGASKKTQIRWEQGESHPGADALAIWIEHGLDVLYVIAGRPERKAADEALTKDERHLLDNYRHSDERGKRAVQSAALALAEHERTSASESSNVADSQHGKRAAGGRKR